MASTDCLVRAALGLVAEGVVEENKSGHGLHHGHGPGKDARIVATSALQGGVGVVHIHRVLLVHDGGDRFEGDPEVDGLTIADAALNSA